MCVVIQCRTLRVLIYKNVYACLRSKKLTCTCVSKDVQSDPQYFQMFSPQLEALNRNHELIFVGAFNI